MGRVRPNDPRADKSRWLRALSWSARQRPVTWFLVNVGTHVDPVLMKLSGGRVRTTLSAPTVLLTHTGAQSGKERSTPLAYFTDGDDVVLIASRGGHERNPAWYHNVRANPEVALWTTGGGGRYLARVADATERERLWELATTFYPGFASYQERCSDRVIPVVICSPRED